MSLLCWCKIETFPLLYSSNFKRNGWVYPVGIYMFKVNNRNTRTRCEICSKLTIKTLERHHYKVLEVNLRRRKWFINGSYDYIAHVILITAWLCNSNNSFRAIILSVLISSMMNTAKHINTFCFGVTVMLLRMKSTWKSFVM